MPVSGGDGGERLAPVTYLPGAEPQRGQARPERAVAAPTRPVTFSPEYWAEDEPVDPRGGDRSKSAAEPAESAGPKRPRAVVARPDDDGLADEGPEADVDAATQVLVKRLRTRQLSSKEAKGMLSERGLDGDVIEGIVADFEARGYLDDARLTEQLVYAATSRKGQGRRAIAQTLAGRGIPRDVVDAALDELPDDEEERALDFARQKARSMGSLDRDAALRRLHGQLARRGFGGSMAMNAAKQALDEAGIGGSSVRFR